MLEKIIGGEPISEWVAGFLEGPSKKKLSTIDDPIVMLMHGYELKDVAKEISDSTTPIHTGDLRCETSIDFNRTTQYDNEFRKFVINKIVFDELLNTSDESHPHEEVLFKKHIIVSRLRSNTDPYYIEIILPHLVKAFDGQFKDAMKSYMVMNSEEYNFFLSIAAFVKSNEKVSKYLKLVNIDLSNFLADITL